MADAVHYLLQTQLSFVAPYFSMGRLYTTGGIASACAMWTYDAIANAL